MKSASIVSAMWFTAVMSRNSLNCCDWVNFCAANGLMKVLRDTHAIDAELLQQRLMRGKCHLKPADGCGRLRNAYAAAKISPSWRYRFFIYVKITLQTLSSIGKHLCKMISVIFLFHRNPFRKQHCSSSVQWQIALLYHHPLPMPSVCYL